MRDTPEIAEPEWATMDPHDHGFMQVFGTYLVEAAIIEPSTFERAKTATTHTAGRFDHVLVKLGLLSEQDATMHLARFLRLPTWDEATQSRVPVLPDLLPPAFVRNNNILPIAVDGARLRLAVVDPFDRLPIQGARLATGLPLALEIISPLDFDRVVKAIYPAQDQRESESSVGADEPVEIDLQRLRDSASGAPVIKLANQVIANAIDARASDIHIEPTVDTLVVRYRIDGVLRVVESVPARLRAALVSRFKILAKLDIAERRLPQDGRFKLAFRGSEIDFRLATIPTVHGEALAIRVLDRARVTLDFESLGFTETQIATLRDFLLCPNGMLLVTGPTGSGKTTTLYTLLKQVNKPDVKIFTVEDPIEYVLDGINQVQVQAEIGLDFPAVLRSILRHNPNLIMVGEVRDAETAAIAVQASLTGHLVFCTLHTNSAAATIGRLMDMGIDNFLLGSVVKGILAQRLVRRLCPHCSRSHPRSELLARSILEKAPFLSGEGAADIRQANGCAECDLTGYLGRLTVAEVMVVDASIQEAIMKRKDAVEIARVARARGMRTMHDDGLLKIWRGLTTLEELIGVTDGAAAIEITA